MLSSPRNSVTHNQQAKLAIDYNELLKELSSHEMTSVGCYAIGDTIGEGTFGKVKKGVHKLTGRQVAIKKISKQHAPMMAREIHHHRQLKHPNIIMLYEMITTESTIHIISEYAPNGDLLDALTDCGRCDEHRVRKWVHQLTDAISYCHTRGIVHRDLKLENILLDMDDNVKICDFGFARFAQKNQYLETFCGSLSYSAPEIILRKKYTGPETDIWSLGVIIYTLLAGEYPFDDDSEVMTQRKIVQVDYQMPHYFSPELSHLIDKMLKHEPSDRITIHDIVDHPWYCQTESVDRILSPSSSTSSANQSDVDSLFSQDTINEESDISTRSCQSSTEPYKFSPQVRSSLGLVKMDDRTTKSPRFSAPAPANRYSKMPSTSYRTSLPSVFPSYRNHLIDDTSVSLPPMTPGEKRLFTALNAAGFDRDALVKMQTGECDTSSTLWHLLLENMSSGTQQSSSLNESVSDAFASALSNQKKETFIDRGIQTTENLETVQPVILTNTKPIELPQAYPTPVIPPPAIQTVGFGSNTLPEKGPSSGWLSSVKSWFGSSKQQQQQLPKQTLRSRSSSNCSTVSSPIPTPPSSYRNFDSPPTAPDAIVMSPPIYRSGSQKYRRRMLQLAQPPVSELDQLAYSATSAKSTRPTQQNYTRQVAPPPFPTGMPSPPAPTAALCPSMRADTFSILTAAQPKEVDICEKRYSMYRSQQPTPPPSPPIASVIEEEQVPTPVSPLEEKQEHELVPDSIPEEDEEEEEEAEEIEQKEEKIMVVEELPIKEVVVVPPPPCNSNSPEIPTQNTLTLENNFSNRSRFEFAPRSRLSLYGMQDQRASVTASKTIIEEEEEEEEE